MRLLLGIACLFLMCPAVAAQHLDPQDWAQYNYDNLGTRHNRAEKELSPENVGRLTEKWRFPPADSERVVGVVHGTPAVVEGCVYFGTTRTNPTFYKLSPDGKLIWEYPITSVMTKELKDPYAMFGLPVVDGVMSSPLVTRKFVFFGTFGGQIICLDREHGNEVWKINTKAAPFPDAHGSNTVMASPILADDKLIVAGGGFEHVLAAIPDYPCCSGRGYVAALKPDTGEVLWKYDVGPLPRKHEPPVEMEDKAGGKKRFDYGPSTSSVWSTPSYDEATKTLFFGTDTHNSPRQPTPDDQRLYNKYSSAVIAISVRDGKEKWVRQISKNDVWNNALPNWDSKTGDYKDVTIGDTPKIYDVLLEGEKRQVVGVGCKNGAFYVIDRASGQVLSHTPSYRGSPEPEMTAAKSSRILALPSAIGGLQTGCAYDGKLIFTNGIDWLGLANAKGRLNTIHPPAGGRVTAIQPSALAETWRHERERVTMPIVDAEGNQIVAGDPVASGIAIAGGVAFFTTTVSNRLVAVSTRTGESLIEIPLGPVWCGPSVSRGRVYVGSGNTLFEPWSERRRNDPPQQFRFPLRATGGVSCFGI